MEKLGNWEKRSYILKPDKKLSFSLISERVGEKNNFFIYAGGLCLSSLKRK